MSSVTTIYANPASLQEIVEVWYYTGAGSALAAITDGTRPSTPADSSYIYHPAAFPGAWVYWSCSGYLAWDDIDFSTSIAVNSRLNVRYKTPSSMTYWDLTYTYGGSGTIANSTSGHSTLTWYDWEGPDVAFPPPGTPIYVGGSPVYALSGPGGSSGTTASFGSGSVRVSGRHATAPTYGLISEVFVAVDTTTYPVATTTNAAVPEVTATPTLQTAYSDTDGWAHSKTQFKVFDSATYTDADFDVENSTAVYDSGLLSSAATSHTVTSALDGTLTYKTYSRVSKQVNGYEYFSDWDTNDAWTIDVPTPELTVSGAYNSTLQSVDLTVTPQFNFFGGDTSYGESSVGDWVGTNATLSTSATYQIEGSNSVLMTVDATLGGASMTTGSMYTVTAGEEYTASGYVRGNAAKNCEVSVEWFTSASASISTSTGTGANCGTSDFDTRVHVTATAPATAAYAKVTMDVNDSVTASDTYYWDCLQFTMGDLSEWSPGFTTATLTVTKTVNGETVSVWDADSMNIAAYYAPFIVRDHEPDRDESGVVYRAFLDIVTAQSHTAIAATDSVTISSDELHWFKVLDDATMNVQQDILNDLSQKIDAGVGVFKPLDATKAIVVSGPVYGYEGSIQMLVPTHADWAANILPIVRYAGTIALLFPDGTRRRVRWIDRDVAAATSGGNVRREVTLGYVEVE